MKKRIWITLILALVIINGLAELVTLYSGLFFSVHTPSYTRIGDCDDRYGF
jgi:hypothetical protein